MHHALYGGCFPVVDRPSGRGPGLIIVRLPDGRERAISWTATDLALPTEASPPPASARTHVSVRTLLPLANYVRAVLASRHGECGTEPRRVARQVMVGRKATARFTISRLGRLFLRSEWGGEADDPAGSGGARDDQDVGVTWDEQHRDGASAGRDRRAVRYHVPRMVTGAIDGRGRSHSKRQRAEAIEHWRQSEAGRGAQSGGTARLVGARTRL